MDDGMRLTLCILFFGVVLGAIALTALAVMVGGIIMLVVNLKIIKKKNKTGENNLANAIAAAVSPLPILFGLINIFWPAYLSFFCFLFLFAVYADSFF